MKKSFYTASALTLGMMVSGVAMADNTVNNTVNSQPIQANSTCDKSGSFTYEFDSNSNLAVGDQLVIDMPLTQTESVTLCKDVDLMISPAGDVDLQDIFTGNFTPWNPAAGGNVPVADSPLTQAVADQGVVDGGVVFHVQGNAGSQRVTIDVLGDDGDSITAGPADGDNLILSFFNQKTNADYVQNGVWKDVDSDDDDDTSVYDTAADSNDNALCINISNWSGSTVAANLDSKDDKFTFQPSNPQIAHIAAAQSYDFYECKGQACGQVALNDPEQEGDATCGFVDNSDESDYVLDTHENNEFIIKSSQPFTATDYQVKLTILVNGQTGDNGVYFTNEDVYLESYESTTDACDDDDRIDYDYPESTYYLASGAATDYGKLLNNYGECAITDAAAKAVQLVTEPSDVISNDKAYALHVEIPTLVYNNLVAGDNVEVQVELMKAPCGSIYTDSRCVIGEVVEAATVAAEGTTTYPYFSQGDNTDAFWDGIAVTNLSNVEGTVTLTMYEADGDIATAEKTIAANSMFVDTISNMITNGDFTLVSGTDGVIGNDRSYVLASSEVLDIDGFAMIANNATGESMGYLPRKKETPQIVIDID